MNRFVLTFAFVLCAPSMLAAQQVRTRGYGEADLDAIIRAALRSNPRIITRDTLIRSGDTVRAHVLALHSRVIVEGTIMGDLTAIESNVYLRPTARVSGAVTNIAGGYYPSELAKTGSVENRPLAPYHVVRTGNEYTIEGTVDLPSFKPIGGALLPEYNRVDGLRVEIGPRVLLPPIGSLEPSIAGSIGYATERKDLSARAELMLRRGRSSLAGGWEDDITLTNDAWIRSQLSNSLSMIYNGKDYRNYYLADRVYVEFRRVLERGDRTTHYWIRGQNELAYPLEAGDPFVLLKPDSVRSNPPVLATRVASMIVGAESQWTRLTTAWRAQGGIELAAKALGADYAFNAYTARILYAAQAIANHTLQIDANFRGPLPGTEELPLQRWTFVGGSGTLYTFRVNQFPGDRLAFVETEYRIPFAPQLKLPLLGRPTLRLMHNIGMAWSQTSDSGFEQNIGARLQFPFVYARVVTNPEDIGGDAKFSAGLNLQSKTYPWEKKR